jgi:thiamine monophosphate synthase
MEQLFKMANDMSVQDLRLAFFNAISLGVSFTHVENSLKIILLLASIVYTFQKIYETQKKKNDKEL